MGLYLKLKVHGVAQRSRQRLTFDVQRELGATPQK